MALYLPIVKTITITKLTDLFLNKVVRRFRAPKVLRDTSMTPYTRPPVSTNLATRDRPRDCRNLRQSTAIYRFPLYSATFH
jgi:hypothetical protein